MAWLLPVAALQSDASKLEHRKKASSSATSPSSRCRCFAERDARLLGNRGALGADDSPAPTSMSGGGHYANLDFEHNLFLDFCAKPPCVVKPNSSFGLESPSLNPRHPWPGFADGHSGAGTRPADFTMTVPWRLSFFKDTRPPQGSQLDIRVLAAVPPISRLCTQAEIRFFFKLTASNLVHPTPPFPSVPGWIQTLAAAPSN
ncbi:hypothetical protein B0H14DRAFT_3431253 [Mycena olivaceomarginata]|nr:hypothetical protein B0H14DRAFT_3431253 [Mycena olivaceomarginata]